MSLYFLLIFLSFSPSTECIGSESQLIGKLLGNADPLSRPVVLGREEDYLFANVTVSLALHQLLEVNEKKNYIETKLQMTFSWLDSRLQWDTDSDFKHIHCVWLPAGKIWRPDIQLANQAEVSDYQKAAEYTNVLVCKDGRVFYTPSMVVKTSCRMDVTWFPFDTQECQFRFQTPESFGKKVKLLEGTVGTGHFMPHAQWKLALITAHEDVHVHKGDPTIFSTGVFYTFRMKRRTLYYLFGLLVPSGLIGFLAILGFTLPPDSGEKFPLGVTVLFSLIVFHNDISNTMPANSEDVPLMGAYFNCILITIALSVVSTIVINLDRRSLAGREIRGRNREIFFNWLPWMVRMKVPDQIPVQTTRNISLDNANGVEDCVGNEARREKVKLEWKYVAIVVDRICLVVAILFSVISIAVVYLSDECPCKFEL